MRRPLEYVLTAIYCFIVGPLALFAALVGWISLGRGGLFTDNFLAAWLWSPEFHLARGFLSGLVYIACGILLLRREGWARFLFLVWSWAMLGINLFTGPHFRGGWSIFAFAQAVFTLVLSYLLITVSEGEAYDA